MIYNKVWSGSKLLDYFDCTSTMECTSRGREKYVYPIPPEATWTNSKWANQVKMTRANMRHMKLLPLKQSRVVYRKPSKMMIEIYIKYLNQKNVWLLTIIRFYYAIHNDMWSIITWVVVQPAYLHQQHMSRHGVQHSDSYTTTKWQKFFFSSIAILWDHCQIQPITEWTVTPFKTVCLSILFFM